MDSTSYFSGYIATKPHPWMASTGSEGRCDLCGGYSDDRRHELPWEKGPIPGDIQDPYGLQLANDDELSRELESEAPPMTTPIRLTAPMLRTLLALYPDGCDVIVLGEAVSVLNDHVHAQALNGTKGALVGGAGVTSDPQMAGCLGIHRDTYLKLVDEGEAAPRPPARKRVAIERDGIESLLNDTVQTGTILRLTYTDGSGNRTVRDIEPYRVEQPHTFSLSDVTYLVARDVEKDEPRHFLLRRIERLEEAD